MAQRVIFPEIRDDIPIPKVVGRGRRKGSGINMFLLRKMKVGSSIWNIPNKKCLSLQHSARKCGVKLRVRRLPNNGLYAIWRIK